MNEVTKERLSGASQAGSLFDRLRTRSTDELPAITSGRTELSAATVRDSILNNLRGLLNTTQLEASQDLTPWKHIQRSVLNFGVPEINGNMLSSVDASEIGRRVTEAIARFEPRLVKETIEVQVVAQQSEMGHRSLQLVIAGDYLEGEFQNSLRLDARVDLESGRVDQIKE
ncbi:MAG: type VI secretion system baseplate subunit TssE [Planctomycetota bacterium]